MPWKTHKRSNLFLLKRPKDSDKNDAETKEKVVSKSRPLMLKG